MIKSWKFHDSVTGDDIKIKVSGLYITLQINDRCYYFTADDGEFDGTSTDHTFKPSSASSPK